MNYIPLIIIGLVGIGIGYYLGQRNKTGQTTFVEKQMELKAENKDNILNFAREKGRIQNDDVEKLVGVSNATAERYLNELEKEGKLSQHGDIGKTVHYTLK